MRPVGAVPLAIGRSQTDGAHRCHALDSTKSSGGTPWQGPCSAERSATTGATRSRGGLQSRPHPQARRTSSWSSWTMSGSPADRRRPAPDRPYHRLLQRAESQRMDCKQMLTDRYGSFSVAMMEPSESFWTAWEQIRESSDPDPLEVLRVAAAFTRTLIRPRRKPYPLPAPPDCHGSKSRNHSAGADKQCGSAPVVTRPCRRCSKQLRNANGRRSIAIQIPGTKRQEGSRFSLGPMQQDPNLHSVPGERNSGRIGQTYWRSLSIGQF